MRRVTMKPPKMLIPAMKTETAPSNATSQLPEPICISAPRMMMEEIALVTAISGVCSECDTFQMTWNPTKQESTKTMKCDMKLAGAKSPASRISAPADDQQADLLLRLRLEGGSFRCALFFRRQLLGLLLRLLRRDRLNLRRRRREGYLALIGDGRATDHVVFHIVEERAILLRRQVRHHVADVGRIERRGLRGHAAREIRVADDGHAVVGNDLLVRNRQVAIAAALGREVNDHRAGLHHGDHVGEPELRGIAAGDQRRGDDDIDVRCDLAELLQLRLAEFRR